MVRTAFLITAILSFGALMRCTTLDLPDSDFNRLPQFKLQIDPEIFDDLLKSSYAKNKYPAEVILDDTLKDAEIKIHGSVTLRLPKKSYGLRTYPGGLGSEIDSDLVLSSQYDDFSFSRYRLALYFFQQAGFFCTGIAPVRLFINSEYQGIYLKLEAIDSLFFIRRNLPIASLYKANVGLNFDVSDGTLAQQLFNKQLPKGDLTYTDIQQLLTVTTNGITEDNKARLEAILDVHSALDYYAVSRLTYNADGVNNNIQLYYNPLVHRFQFIPWDLNYTFYSEAPPLTLPANGLFEKLETIDSYRQYLHMRERQLFNLDQASALLDSFFNDAHAALEADPWMGNQDERSLQELSQMHQFLAAVDSTLRNDTSK